MTSPRPFNRREFIIGLGAGAGAAALPGVVRAAQPKGKTFLHGVASGDPLANAVIIWTRVSGINDDDVDVKWEVAIDECFHFIVKRGEVEAKASSDFTVKVDVTGLPANGSFFYRFKCRGQQSPVGRTRTLPTGDISQLKLGVFSCSNYPAGYFNAYAEAAKMPELFAALHIGDYIYEYPRGAYASADAAGMNREVLPATELLVLQDYRQRYAQYHTDADLQALHAAMPWICVWDDHEVANDSWKAGAENHTPGVEGDYSVRRAAAMQAYYEWLPVRQPDLARPDHLYRSFTFGKLIDLHMLDTRHLARDKQLDYADYTSASGFDAARFTADMASPTRQMLGAEQSQWLASRLTSTSATWTLLGQQVLMSRMNVPAPLVLGQISFTNYSQIVAKAMTAPATLTPQEQAVLAQPAIPYNLDAWDGYAVAREQLLGLLAATNKNVVVLAGDTHNAWASDLQTRTGQQVAVEFATPGVSSPGLEEYFPNENPLAVAAGLEQIIGPLVYAETAHRGFVVVTITPDECRADWHFVSTVKSKAYTHYVGKSLRTLPGEGNRKVVAV
jgi:alkaline phosphatase D